jgi:hypothetical protein
VEEKAKQVSLFADWLFAYSSTPKMEAICASVKFGTPTELHIAAPNNTLLLFWEACGQLV